MLFDLDSAIRVKGFGRVFQPKGNWHNGKRFPKNILLLVLTGEMQIEMKEERFCVRAGDLLFIPANVFYRPLDGGACTYFFLHFTASTLPESTQTPLYIAIAPHTNLRGGYAYSCLGSYPSAVRIPTFVPSAHPNVHGLFERAARLKPNKSFSDQLLLDHILRELLLALDETRPVTNKRLEEITDYIEQNYVKDLSLSVLAEQFSVSASFIARLFRTYLGQKPSEYINNIRVSVAGTLLSETALSITEIAEKTGFSNVYYFSRVFKRITGISPSKARSVR